MSKAYFPRLFVPLAAVTSPLIDFALTLPILGLLMVNFHWYPGWQIVVLPLFLLLAMLAGLGVSLWLAPITVRYRDIAFTLPFVISLWFYATPIAYPAELFRKHVAAKWHWVVDYNPMTGVIDGFRWCLLSGEHGGTTAPTFHTLAPSVAATVVLVLTGLVNFRRGERTFVDIL